MNASVVRGAYHLGISIELEEEMVESVLTVHHDASDRSVGTVGLGGLHGFHCTRLWLSKKRRRGRRQYHYPFIMHDDE